MKCLFIINPVSGTKTMQRSIDTFMGQLILKTEVNTIDTFFTKGKNDAFQKCASLKENEYDFVVVVGGDGTVNESMGGLWESDSHVPMALIPGGTVNDFSTFLKLPVTPMPFVKLINDFHVEEIDLGKVNGTYFSNVVAGGMFSDIGFEVSKEDKNRFGPMAYYIRALLNAQDQLSSDLHLEVEVDDKTFAEEASLFLIMNTSRVGGFDGLTPYASVQDGKFDLLIIRKGSVTDLISLLKDYRFSAHLESPMIHYEQSSKIKISCKEKIIYDVDGEKGENFPIYVENIKKAVPLIVPQHILEEKKQ